MSFPTNSQFTAITVGGSPYADVVNDMNPASTDIVGNATFPSFYYAYDDINVYFRMRVRSDPRNSTKTSFANFAWGVLFNTTGVAGTYDWLLAVNGLNNQVNLIQNTVKQVNSWDDSAEGTNGKGNPNYSRSIINFDVARVLQADSSLGNTQNYFIDFLIPASTFFSYLGINAQSPVQMVAFTSANNNNYNKDSLRTSEGFSFANALSNPTTINTGNVRAKLQITKSLISGPTSPVTGQIAQWTGRILLTNIGKSTAKLINVTDIVSLDVVSNFAVATVSQGTTAYNTVTKTLTWSVGNLAPGATATLEFVEAGLFYTPGNRVLNTARATGFDSFTGGDLTPISANISVNVQATGGAAGTVLDGATGQPVPTTTVRLLSGATQVAVTETDVFGKYSFANIAPSTYTIEFSKIDYTTLSQGVVIQAETITIINPILSPIPGILQGTVRSSISGAPINGADIFLSDSLGTVIAKTISSPTGEYTFPSTTPGYYTVSVSASGFESVTIGQRIPSNQTTIADFSLEANPGTVTGTISGEGVQIAGALVEALSSTGIAIASAITDGAGNYTINKLAPGSYRLRVSAPLFQTFVVGFSIEAGETEIVNANLLANPGSIQGTVLDEDTGEPLPGTSLKIVSSSGITQASVTTDGNGQFVVDSLAPDAYIVTFLVEGHGTRTIGVYVESDAVTTVNVSLRRLVGVLTGVITGGGSPIIGATVDVVLNGSVVSKTVTDENGNYTINGLAPDRYTVIIGADNYSAATIGAQIIDNETTILNAELLSLFGTFSGSVRDNVGNPIAGAVVLARSADSDVLISRVVTDSAGSYTIGKLSPGSYILSTNFNDFQTGISGGIISAGSTSIVNFVLFPNPASILGTVVDNSGQPIVGASIQIQLMDGNGSIISTTFTDLDGTFIVEDLPPATYNINVSAENFQSASASIKLTPGVVSPVTISLVPNPGLVTGMITESVSGLPIAGATVNVTNVLGKLIDTTLTNSDGSFNSVGLPPNFYTLTVIADGYQTTTVGTLIPAGLTQKVDIAMTPNPGSITGTVSPLVTDAMVQLYTMDNQFINATAVNPEGVFLFQNLAPGNYIVKASAMNYAVGFVGAIVESDQATSISISLNPNPGSVSGGIVSDLGVPLSNVTILLLDSNETPIGNGTTDQNGNYTIGNIPVGSYGIVIRALGFASATGNVAISPGQNITDLNFAVETIRGSISGDVLDAVSGLPIVGATILIRDSIGLLVRFTSTDQYGNFLVRNILPDSYSVTASASNYSTGITGVIVQSEETSGATLLLTSTVGTIMGSITDEGGNPLSGDNIRLKLFGANGELLQALIAQSNGQFKIPELSEGTYFISATLDGYSPNNVAVIVTSNEVTMITVPLAQILTTLSGTVIDTDTGNPITDTAVSLYLTDNTGFHVAKVFPGIDGSYTFSSIAPGSYLLNAIAEGYGNQVFAVNIGLEGFIQDVSLTSNPGSVTGFVTNQLTGEPITNAIINISSLGKPLDVKAVSDSFGQFTYPNLRPDSYRVVINADGFSSQTATFTILPGQTTSLSSILTPEPGFIIGRVTDVTTGNPIANSTIYVRYLTPTGPILAKTLTDEEGNYITQGVYPGDYTVIVFSDERYGSSSASVFIESNTTRRVDFVLKPFPSAVSGVVRSADTGEPISGVLISLLDIYGFTIRGVSTDKNGFYFIDGFNAGQYFVTAISPNYQRVRLSIDPLPGEEEKADFSLILEPGQVQGVILDEQTQSPLVGALVELYTPGATTPIARRVTGAEGNFLIEGLAPRSYTLNAVTLNYQIRTAGIVVNAAETTSIQLALIPNPASVSGTITDSAGVPLTNASVRLVNENDIEIGNGSTNLDGIYEIGDLPPGYYTVIVGLDGYSSSTSGVSLQPGDQLTGINVSLTPLGGTITGNVVDEFGEPLPGTLITFLTPEGIPIIATNANDQGNFSSILLDPGTYTVIATSPYYFQSQLGVIVLPDETSTLNFVLNSVGGQITGVVVDENGNPILGSFPSIRLLNVNGVLLQSFTALADGRFVFSQLPEGAYQINVRAENYQAVTVGAFVNNGEVSNLIVSLPEERGSVEGVIVNASSGNPLPGSFVELRDTRGILISKVTSDQAGIFRFIDLPPGSVNIRASAPGFGSESIGSIISAGEVTNAQLNLSPLLGNLNGTILDNTGNPIGTASVQIIDSTGTPIVTVLTDALGKYEVSGLSPGQYTITASADNFGSTIGAGAVVPNETTIVDLVLIQEGGFIQGIITNRSTGEPLLGAAVELKIISPFGPVIETALTDSTGYYRFERVSSGTYLLQASNQGFGTESGSIRIENGETSTRNFTLDPVPASVRGVITSGETPLVKTVVTLINAEGVNVAVVQTDEQGRFFVQNFSPGAYTLVAVNENYQSGKIGFEVVSGEEAEVNFNLAPLPGTLSGVIVNQLSGSPISGSIIQIYAGDSVQPITSSVSDPDGTYTINGLQPGPYIVVITAPNFNTYTTGVTISANEASIADGFLLENPGVVSGTVLSPLGTVSEAAVKVIDVNGSVVGTAITNSDGTFVIGNLSAGTYAVTVVAQGLTSDTQGVFIVAGQTSNVSFNLDLNPGNITGTVTDTTGNFLPGVVVNVILNDIIIATAVTDRNGSYAFEGLNPNSYQISANLFGYAVESVGAVVVSDNVTTANLILSEEFGNILGTVTDRNGNPIIQRVIQINLYDQNNVLVTTVLAESDGTYIIPQIKQGDYVINVKTRGFAPGTFAVEVFSGEDTPLNLPLEDVGGTLTILVLDSTTSNPVTGVLTGVYNTTGLPITEQITDQNGSLTLQNLEEGLVIISAVRPGYSNISQGVIIEEGQTTQAILAISPETGDLTGIITNSLGAPIPGAIIQIIDANRAVVTSVLTQTDGTYAVIDLLPGIYTMIVSAPGYEQRSLSAVIAPNETTITNLILSGEPGSVEGIVTDAATGAFLSGTNIELRKISSSGPVVATTLTDDQGRYRFSRIPAGNYTIVATNKQYGNDSAAISVESANVTFLDLQLSPATASVSGTVRNSDGSIPLINTLLRLSDQNGVVIAEVQTDINGDFLIEGLLPGEFSLTALNNDYRSNTISFTAEPNIPNVVNFNLISIPSTFTGTVTDAETGLPIVGAIVETFDLLGRPIAVALTNIEGVYTLTGLSNGTFTLRASAQGFGSDGRQSTLLINDTNVENFVLPINPGSISGTVIIAGNGPLSKATIRVFDEKGVLVSTTFTEEDGSYFIGNLSAGIYSVIANAEGYLEDSLNVQLEQGQNLKGINFALVPGADGDITGQVTDSGTGEPISGVIIQIFDEKGQLVAEVKTNESGVYSLLGIPAGTYELRAVASGFQPFSTIITLAAGEELLLPISLVAITPVPPVPGAAQFYIIIGSSPISLDGSGKPTIFTLERIDSAANCALFTYEAIVGGVIRRRNVTFDLTCINLVRV
ncbi:carboxypeptidase regulatory-like domain-containing protein [Fictibacillus norfolkensis]|uniref:Carboxypeptidase regulatory-like domain-containing protein n=1 Tax=Fictibacillus norfolkensis TaxID=2762233 RepID=A0ABR8SQY5_9BACL|nr:carboxypeptidase regulatory-like domain-containing protein [Fictibacillus norfolkensis]MBD7965920.1 carboxypeptidase regulatory-like domain-containing protein [Fictibacillus norfolkensis]